MCTYRVTCMCMYIYRYEPDDFVTTSYSLKFSEDGVLWTWYLATETVCVIRVIANCRTQQ